MLLSCLDPLCWNICCWHNPIFSCVGNWVTAICEPPVSHVLMPVSAWHRCDMSWQASDVFPCWLMVTQPWPGSRVTRISPLTSCHAPAPPTSASHLTRNQFASFSFLNSTEHIIVGILSLFCLHKKTFCHDAFSSYLLPVFSNWRRQWKDKTDIYWWLKQ